MKYIVEFTLPVFCSCIIDSENEVKAWETISNYTFNQLKQQGLRPQVDESNFENEECDVIDVKPFQENVK